MVDDSPTIFSVSLGDAGGSGSLFCDSIIVRSVNLNGCSVIAESSISGRQRIGIHVPLRRVRSVSDQTALKDHNTKSQFPCGELRDNHLAFETRTGLPPTRRETEINSRDVADEEDESDDLFDFVDVEEEVRTRPFFRCRNDRRRSFFSFVRFIAERLNDSFRRWDRPDDRRTCARIFLSRSETTTTDDTVRTKFDVRRVTDNS